MRPARLGAVLSGLMLLAACTSPAPAPNPAPSAAPAPCRTDVLAAPSSAVLWAGPEPAADPGQAARAALPATVLAIDVRTGLVTSLCPLPSPSGARMFAQDHALAAQQGGADYPAYVADADLMLRTQYFSPDFRWFSAPGLPLVDVAGGRVVDTGWSGATVGLGRDVALIRTGATWCTRTLPPKPGEACAPLATPGGAGSFVIGPAGAPVWVPAAAQPFAFDAATGYAITDGTRLYGAETLTAAARRAAPDKLRPGDPPVDLDPAGRGGFAAVVPGQPPGWTKVNDWFSVEAAGNGGIRTTYHHTTARNGDISWMWGGARDRSRAIADGGRVAVTAAFQSGGGTRFGALVDGTNQVVDLTRDRGLKCPRPDSFCRILSWPDGSLGTQSAPAP